MADTQRTLSALQTLLADNNTRAISAQDIRDFLVSTFGGYAGLSMNSNAVAQTINIAPSKVTHWTSNQPAFGPTPDYTNSQITIATAGVYLVSFSLSGVVDASKLVELSVYKNGVSVSGASASRHGAANDIGVWSVAMLLTCAAADVIAVYAASESNGTGMTLTDGTMIVTRVG